MSTSGHGVVLADGTVKSTTVYERKDGQKIVVHHSQSLLSLLGDDLLKAIKEWTKE